MEFVVGREMALVGRHGGVFDVVVTKVGRKYATVTGVAGLGRSHKIDMVSLRVDDESVYTIHESRESYERKLRVNEAWKRFRDDVSHNWQPPTGLTAETIEQARELLGIAGRP